MRALRVYERYGLITPERAPNGWRLYDAGDLARLNMIVTLKSLGLSLSKIQEVVCTRNPLRYTAYSRSSCKLGKQSRQKRSAALVRAALDHLSIPQTLRIDELTTLIRSTTMSDGKATSRRVIPGLS